METKYITPEHLKTLITVIDMVTERGALKGSELMTVSELRNNLTLELEFYVQEQQRLQQEAARTRTSKATGRMHVTLNTLSPHVFLASEIGRKH